MNPLPPSDIRNLAILGHSGVGKTSTAEALLFAAGVTKRLGRVSAGTSVMDHAPDEIERKITIDLGMASVEWEKTRFNLLDAPGYPDFYGDVTAAARAVDCAMLVVRAEAGAEVGTEKVWEFAERGGLPAILVVNRMDREHAGFEKAVGSCSEALKVRAVPAYLPVGEGEAFTGVIDLLGRALYRYAKDGSGKATREAIPDGEKERVEAALAALAEAAAEADDALLEHYLEGGKLSDEEIAGALVKAVRLRKAVPAIPVSAEKNIGFAQLLSMIKTLVPSPADMGETALEGGKTVAPSPDGPLVALCFKMITEGKMGELSFLRVFSGTVRHGAEVKNVTHEGTEKVGTLFHLVGSERRDAGELRAGDIGAAVKLRHTHVGDTLCTQGSPGALPPIEFPAPTLSVAIVPKSKGEEDKIASGLARLQEEDRTFKMQVDPELHQTIISGLGELHLDVMVHRLKARYGVEVEMVKPKVPYHETVRGKATVQGKYKKQTGGRGQYGDVWLRVEPLRPGEGFKFSSEVVGGSVPSKFFPAVEKGVRESMARGVYAGYPVVDVAAVITDGSYHDVDSSDMAFKVAGSMAFRKAFMESKPVLTEPIYEIEVTIPDDKLGDVMGDLSGKRGKILGVDARGSLQVVKALVPFAEMYKYATHLRSMTQGRGYYQWKLAHYEEVPREISEKIRSEADLAKDEE